MAIVTYTMPRPFASYSIPIAIQSCYIRDFCARNNIEFKLPITEMCKKSCFESLKGEIAKLDNNNHKLIVTSVFVFDELKRDDLDWFKINTTDNLEIIGILEMVKLTFSKLGVYQAEVKEIEGLAGSRTINE